MYTNRSPGVRPPIREFGEMAVLLVCDHYETRGQPQAR